MRKQSAMHLPTVVVCLCACERVRARGDQARRRAQSDLSATYRGSFSDCVARSACGASPHPAAAPALLRSSTAISPPPRGGATVGGGHVGYGDSATVLWLAEARSTLGIARILRRSSLVRGHEHGQGRQAQVEDEGCFLGHQHHRQDSLADLPPRRVPRDHPHADARTRQGTRTSLLPGRRRPTKRPRILCFCRSSSASAWRGSTQGQRPWRGRHRARQPAGDCGVPRPRRSTRAAARPRSARGCARRRAARPSRCRGRRRQCDNLVCSCLSGFSASPKLGIAPGFLSDPAHDAQ